MPKGVYKRRMKPKPRPPMQFGPIFGRAVLVAASCLIIGLLVWQAIRIRNAGDVVQPTPTQATATQATRTNATPSDATIRIMSWNVRQFTYKHPERIARIAEIIKKSDADLVALQELFSKGRGLRILLTKLGKSWRQSTMNTRARNGEQLAYIYNADVVRETARAHDLRDPGAPFARIPHIGYFKAGEFDFILVNCHLIYTDPQKTRRRHEASQLAYHGQRMLHVNNGEKDIIFIGDFNEQTSYKNLHLIEEHGYQRIFFKATNLGDTQSYDNILYHKKYTGEYTGVKGIIKFDETMFRNNDPTARKLVSDHRPVFADFSTAGPDDD